MSLTASASSAAGTVTIGSNLSATPNASVSSLADGTTAANASLPTSSLASGGLASPVNGTVVGWRIRVGGASTPTVFRVIKRLGGGLSTGGGTSASVTPPLNATTPYPAQLPIAIGDLIGINCCASASAFFFATTAGGVRERWIGPPLADGGPGRAPTFVEPTNEVLLSADITPTNTFELGDVGRNKKKGTATLEINNVSNPGQLVLFGKGLKQRTLTVGAPGSFELKVKSKGNKLELLNEDGQVKVKPKVRFTPSGGDANTQPKKLKLRKNV